MKSTFKFRWLILIIPSILIGVVAVVLVLGRSASFEILPEIQARSIADSSLSLHRISGLSDECIANADFTRRPIAAFDTLVAYLSFDGTRNDGAIHLYETANADERWRAGKLNGIFNMVASEVELYAVVPWEVRAYDLDNGQLIWDTQDFPGHTTYHLIRDETGRLFLHSTYDTAWSNEAVIREIDPDSGNIDTERRIPLEEFSRIVPYSPLRYVYFVDSRLWFVPQSSEIKPWRLDLDERIRSWPVTFQHLLIVRSGYPASLRAIDTRTGEVIWRDTRGYASNPVVFGNIVYALANDARLLALDPYTGQDMGSMQFLPDVTDNWSRQNLYMLSASSEILVVYFGDSCEMFVFEDPAA